MNDASATMMLQRPPLGFLDRVAALASWVVGGAIFLTVGWYAMEPDDPLGAVSAFSRAGGMMMLLQAAALAGVAGALATVLAGRRLVDVGTFAVSLGLGLVSLRGGTAAHLLIQGSEVSGISERGLALRFALETVGWFAVMAVAVCVSAVVMRWCYGMPDESDRGRRAKAVGADMSDDPKTRHGRAALGQGARMEVSSIAWAWGPSAGFDIPRVSAWCFGQSGDRRTATADGIKHTLVATGVGLLVISVLSAGLSSRSIQHGQVCFVVAAAVFLASYVACRVSPVRSALWPILSVGLMAVLGYVWASVRPSVPSLPPYAPSSHFLRVLPIQFIAVGTTSALATFWYMFIPVVDSGGSPQTRHAKV